MKTGVLQTSRCQSLRVRCVTRAAEGAGGAELAHHVGIRNAGGDALLSPAITKRVIAATVPPNVDDTIAAASGSHVRNTANIPWFEAILATGIVSSLSVTPVAVTPPAVARLG